jgi:hypothetical protein
MSWKIYSFVSHVSHKYRRKPTLTPLTLSAQRKFQLLFMLSALRLARSIRHQAAFASLNAL